jgi:hypothetical protein
LLAEEHGPADFWDRAVEVAGEFFSDAGVHQLIRRVRDSRFETFRLEDLFTLLANGERRIVLLIDEFDTLIAHPRFSFFFGTLRSLATNTGGLALVTASRMAVAEMNRRTELRGRSGSPFFNNFVEKRLGLLSRGETVRLVDMALAASGVTFFPEDYDLIAVEAGGHPYLVQVAGSSVFDAFSRGLSDEPRAECARRLIDERAAPFIEDLMTHGEKTNSASTVPSQAIARWVARHSAAAPPGAAVIRDRRFRVAFSFPGELKPLLASVIDALKERVSIAEIFSYPLYEAELARIDLDLYLHRIYSEQSELVVAFLCAGYDAKPWCGVEWRVLREMIKDRRGERLMLFRTDDAEISGLSSLDGYVDARGKSAVDIARLIQTRLGL